jgi:hypothetical protein
MNNPPHPNAAISDPFEDTDQSTAGDSDPDEAGSTADPIPEKAKPSFRVLGIIEAGIVLGSVDLLFAAFVVIQFTYFFGGRDTVAISGLTYSEYARSGFFELVTAAVLVLGMVLLAGRITHRATPMQETIFRTLAIIIVLLTGVMLVSAWQRMALYEQEFGFTHLRIYTHVFMLWMGVLFAVYIVTLFWHRPNLFSLGLVLVVIGNLVTLNLINPDHLIAQRNIDRYHQGYDLDLGYFLTGFSSDIVPPMLTVYEETQEADPVTHECLGMILQMQHRQLDRLKAGSGATVFSANWSRDRAWSLLDPIADDLPTYDYTEFRENCWLVNQDGTDRSIAK